ncbi:hypothetical protein [Kutzneria sp. 744]|uniref:hypothetical protein n=1 Tax=Kutzneria sp. (strain 744) TaxID=345341 RepID=UPI0003EECBDB|nr:hypothetical protein [Kutzneria sp. 744]EWM10581.1 hypothetical protein KUTG_00885 [Kutzneria sp. 744]
MAVARENGFVSEEANAVGQLAWIDRRRGKLEHTIERFEWVVDTAGRIGNVQLAAQYLVEMAECHRERDDVGRARAAWSRALLFYSGRPRGRVIERIEEGLASLA